MISQTFSPELKEFVQGELAAGRYQSETELVQAAVQLLREREQGAQRLREELAERIASLERGEGIELEDDDALRTFLATIESSVSARLGSPNARRSE